MNREQVIIDGVRIGEVYQASNGAWIAELDRHYGYGSESFLMHGQAKGALELFGLDVLTSKNKPIH